MGTSDFTTAILVKQTPAEVYQAINKPQAWWSDSIEGAPDKLHETWNYHFKDNHRSKIKTLELIPDTKVVWLIEENYFKNAADQSEWVGNKIIFEIATEGGETKLTFTQIGLTPACNCYKSCEWAWNGFVQQSLRSLITTGNGQLTWYEEKQ